MRNFLQVLGALALAALPAAALEREFADQLIQSAQNVERDATAVSRVLKTKGAPADEVKQKIEAMSADVTKLQELVNQFDATHPALSARDKADWELVKTKVQVLEIFHERKKALASEDVAKHRSMLRAFADGVAQRAKRLQQTAATLRRG